ncbi:YicC family protein [bacterium]|nr:YicC family protein [candidate division CSSED10-310 bacterium]
MAYSMTGLGEARVITDSYDIKISIKSVNHRFLQLNVKTPKGFQSWEKRIRDVVGKEVSRGKVDVWIDCYKLPAQDQEFHLNEGYAEKIAEAANLLSQKLSIPCGITIENILRYPDVFINFLNIENDDVMWKLSEEALIKALDNFLDERRRDGLKMIHFVDEACKSLDDKVAELEHLAEVQKTTVRHRFLSNLKTLMGTVDYDQNRMEQEIALLIMKSDITEEITRLHSHIRHFLELLHGSQKVIGKQCDFLVQEMHREVNTIGSKSTLTALSDIVIFFKVQIEKIREQIQNLE